MANNGNIIQEQDIQNDERISLYMQGKMDAEEEVSFLEELKNNDDLRNQAVAQARLVKGMKQVDEELTDAFRQADEQTIKRIATKVTGSKRHYAQWLAVAASIVFVVFIGFKSYDYYDTTSLGRLHANDFPMSSIIRGDANADVEKELTTLFFNVAEGKDLDNTTSRLATLWELAKQDTYNDYTDYAPYIGWNLAIGYLENYEKAKAREILMEMKQLYTEESAVGEKSIELFNKI